MSDNQNNSIQWLKTSDAAEYVSLSESALKKLKAKGLGPKTSDVLDEVDVVRYSKRDLDAWMSGNYPAKKEA